MMCGWGKCRTWGNNTTPLYCLPATTVAGWLEDLEQIRNYEYAHIFDDRLTRCCSAQNETRWKVGAMS